MNIEQKRQLCKLLLDCATMEQRNHRDAVVNDLPKNIQDRISRDTSNIIDVRNIVDTYLDFNDKPNGLIEIIRFYEGDSIAMQAVLDFVDKLVFLPGDDIKKRSKTDITLFIRNLKWNLIKMVILLSIGGIGLGISITLIVFWVKAHVNSIFPIDSYPISPRVILTPLIVPNTRTMTPTEPIQPFTGTMEMIEIPAGEFTMGSDSGTPDETPIHIVYLDTYSIDKYEVTNGRYADCVGARKCEPPKKNDSAKRRNYYGETKFANYPVIYVDWYQAKAYCEWVDKRLPTEAEWEKAARGNDGREYPWKGKITCSKANYWGRNMESCMGDTTEIGSYKDGVSFYKLHDMAGNVSEWVADWYDPKYYEVSLKNNPKGPDLGMERVVRGGTWEGDSGSVRSTSRGKWKPEEIYYATGFRCAR